MLNTRALQERQDRREFIVVRRKPRRPRERPSRRQAEERERAVLRNNRQNLFREARALIEEQARP